jgi:hypothetical protein
MVTEMSCIDVSGVEEAAKILKFGIATKGISVSLGRYEDLPSS